MGVLRQTRTGTVPVQDQFDRAARSGMHEPKYKLISPDTYIDTDGEDWSNKDFVVVGTASKIEGILTISDVWGVLNDFAECFVLLFEIETELRDFILEVIPEKEMEAAVGRVHTGPGSKKPTSRRNSTSTSTRY